MAPFKPVYSVRTKEEFSELEEAWEKLLESYSFELTCSEVNVKKDYTTGRIDISPKEGKIEKIVLVGGKNAPAHITEMSPGRVEIAIIDKEIFYRIHYNAEQES